MAETNLSPLEAYEKYAALGPDFLTFLLVRVLEDEVPPPPSEPGLKVDIQGPMLFTGDEGEARKVTLAGEEAAGAPEVLSALRQGKRLRRAKLILTAVTDTYAFTIDADTFDLKGIKLPVPPIPDLDEYLSMRVQSTQRLHQLVDELFEGFLQVRLTPDEWKAELARWKKLAKG